MGDRWSLWIHWLPGPAESFQNYLALRRISEQVAWLKRLHLGSGCKCICFCIGLLCYACNCSDDHLPPDLKALRCHQRQCGRANILLSEFCNSLPPVFTVKLTQVIERGREVFVIFVQFRSVTEHICVQEFGGLQLLLQKIQLRFFFFFFF